MPESLDKMALDYHRFPVPGKLRIEPTKRMVNQRDLALAYSPGVAAACRVIVDDPLEAASVTARGNLVGVISNGTAVLGLGAIGPLAAKPVMEGKAVLFKKFAGIDVFDIEIDENDPDKLVDIIASLEPTFGAINLEDIKAPESFIVEAKCRERMSIPVFHDDQHGTAICVGAAVQNGLKLANKDIATTKIACSGADAAALACLDLLVALGAHKENISVIDRDGVLYEGRQNMDPYKAHYARDTNARTLADIVEGADIFLGLSAPGVLAPEHVKTMADNPLILALANPDPEILPEEALAVRPDAILATGRSDYPNQVNNVLCFPFIFRGALDVGATTINDEMKIAACAAIAELAQAEPSDVVARAYKGESLQFGRDYILPKPFDPRLITKVAPAVAKAAMDSGVATRPLKDFDDYRISLGQIVYKSGGVMEPVFQAARGNPRRVVYAEGEDPRVLRAVQIALDDGLAKPILIGRRSVIQPALKEIGLRFKLDTDVPLVDPTNNPREKDYRAHYLSIAGRKGVTPEVAANWIRTRNTVLGAIMLELGEADSLLCGATEPFRQHLDQLIDTIQVSDGISTPAAMQLIVLRDRYIFVCDTSVAFVPSPEHLADIAVLAASEVRRFGLEPKVALVSHSNFGASNNPTAKKMRRVRELLLERHVDFEFEGEMRADATLIPDVRDQLLPHAEFEGAANLLIMPNLDAANIAFNLAWSANDGLAVGPFLMGFAKSAHVLSNSVTVRGIVNMTAMAVVDAQDKN